VEENRYTLPRLREIKHAIRDENPIATKCIAIPPEEIGISPALILKSQLEVSKKYKKSEETPGKR